MKSLSRRDWLKMSGAFVATAAMAPLVFVSQAEASTLVSKASVHYQDHPSGQDMCSNCANFVPGASGSAFGTCKVVAGKISPHGYCYDYVPM
ncbi:high-potential iron-sulfur protein [Acidithiobacillus sp. AMEEHan]|uniref:high-potential iron-sulfur protein n=1 Tax=Acidithiobacillus sp. AMEEHan TaxID=2994951 RepID=UPI0027E4B15E|nr:high-potential iron-sulfur protein [Acidithiobacillus sp. AMEEHan]